MHNIWSNHTFGGKSLHAPGKKNGYHTMRESNIEDFCCFHEQFLYCLYFYKCFAFIIRKKKTMYKTLWQTCLIKACRKQNNPTLITRVNLEQGRKSKTGWRDVSGWWVHCRGEHVCTGASEDNPTSEPRVRKAQRPGGRRNTRKGAKMSIQGP